MHSTRKYSRYRRQPRPDVMSSSSLELLKKIREYNMSGHIPSYNNTYGGKRGAIPRHGRLTTKSKRHHHKRRNHTHIHTRRIRGGSNGGNSPELFVPYAQGSGSSSLSSNYSRLMSGLAQSRENGSV
jgi:hypothetical protein